MKKKVTCLLLVVVLIATAVMMVACNPGGGAGDANFVVPEGGYDGSAVTIKFYHTMGANLSTVLDAYIKDFNVLYPNITIEHEQVGGYDDVRTQVSTEINVGAQPNIAYCYPDHVALYNVAGAVVQLDNLIASEEVVTRADGSTETLGLTQAQKDDFIQGYYNEGKQFGDEHMYTMPLSKSTEVLYYNKTFFAACRAIYTSDIELDLTGKPVYAVDEDGQVIMENGAPKTKPNPNKGNENYNFSLPTTWDELEVVCRKIKAIDPTCIPLGYDSEANWFITMCEQYGSPYTSAEEGNHFLFNNDTNKAFVKEFRSWHQEGLVTTQEIYGAYTSGLFVAQTGTKSYMSIGSSAGATHQRPAKVNNEYPFDVGIASIPQVSQSNPKVISQGPSLCIFGKENAQEVIASWLFVKFLTTTVEFQAEFSMVSGYVPVIKSVAQNETYAAFLAGANGGDSIAALSTKVCLDQEEYYYTSPAFNGSSQARDEVGALMVKCLGEKTNDVDALINQAFQAAIDECEYNS